MFFTLFLACCYKLCCYFDVFIPLLIVITRFGNVWHKSFVISGGKSVKSFLFSMIFTLFLACCHKICCYFDVFIPLLIVITRFGNVWHKSFVISGGNSVKSFLFSMIFTLFLACCHKVLLLFDVFIPLLSYQWRE